MNNKNDEWLKKSMEDFPLVTLVCICFNQGKYLFEAISSIKNQDYSKLEVIFIDDASSDESAEILSNLATSIQFRYEIILHEQNAGLCKTFNEALGKAKGKYIIDMAADDFLEPQRISRQVEAFEKGHPTIAVCFSDAWVVNDEGKRLWLYSKRLKMKKVPQGQVFQQLFEVPFICPPTVMFRTDALKQAGGYDENLVYEDFDIWMRLARNYNFEYVNEPLMNYRHHFSSLSNNPAKKKAILRSTYQVIQKGKNLYQTESEKKALGKFSSYQIRLAVYSGCLQEGKEIYGLLKTMGEATWADSFFGMLCEFKISLQVPYSIYCKWFR